MGKYTNLHGVANALNKKFGWDIKADRKLAFLLNDIWEIRRGNGPYRYLYNLNHVFSKLLDADTYLDAKCYLKASEPVEWRNFNRPRRQFAPRPENKMPEADMDYMRKVLDRKIETESVNIYVTESQVRRLFKQI